MKSDVEIAREHVALPLEEIANRAGLLPKELCYYGKNKAKIDQEAIERVQQNEPGKLVLVTAITPTPAGEGKTTVSIGLADGLNLKGVKTMLALREPSLGPVFGVKGGATGGGMAQIVPMDEINLHFTGDLHAIGVANNLLAAMVDNHIFQGNEKHIKRVTWKRCMDMNDRQLRVIQSGLGGSKDGVPREDGFDITAASEVMATLCLASDLEDLTRRLGNLIVGYDEEDHPVTAKDLHAEGAMAALLKEAMQPNLVQSLGGTPALVHGGPFANIAHGCNTVAATNLARRLADVTVTEAGFGADLGAEKFLDIKCRKAGIWPDACVVVATVRALKFHGGVAKDDLNIPNVQALRQGLCNLQAHVENMAQKFQLPTVVALNRFVSDSDEELETVLSFCENELGVKAVLTEVWAKGGQGALALADAVLQAMETPNNGPHFLYDQIQSIEDKIRTIATKIYGAKDVSFTDQAKEQMRSLTENGFGKTPVCMAKTQMSLSDDAKKKGRPQDFVLTVRSMKVSAGAGFIVALTGQMMTMPGLPKTPAAENICINEQGQIDGIF